jgi:GH25 family lysozyme M1 (1,4-beta-N-acetylmuramidase)
MTDLCYVADLGSLNTVDFKKLAAASYNGIKCAGVIHRATRSNGAVDVAYGTRLPQIIAAGLLPGAYAFNTGETAAIQAARFIKATSPDIPNLLRALDFERNPEGAQMTLSGAIEFLDRVDQAFGRATTLYSGDWIKSLIVGATDAQRDFLADHAPWIPEYGPECKMVDANGKPLPWPAPFLWQFTGDGVGNQPHTLDGLQASADLSLFNGTRDQLAKVWRGEIIAQAVQPPEADLGGHVDPGISEGFWAKVAHWFL